MWLAWKEWLVLWEPRHGDFWSFSLVEKVDLLSERAGVNEKDLFPRKLVWDTGSMFLGQRKLQRPLREDTGQGHLRLLVALLGTHEHRISCMETKAMRVGWRKRHKTPLGTELPQLCSPELERTRAH